VRKSAAHFKVIGCHVDGRPDGTLTVEAPTPRGVVLVTYKPSRGRDYTLTLPEVCEMIAWRAVKKEVGR
jgi:hypothetical protein